MMPHRRAHAAVSSSLENGLPLSATSRTPPPPSDGSAKVVGSRTRRMKRVTRAYATTNNTGIIILAALGGIILLCASVYVGYRLSFSMLPHHRRRRGGMGGNGIHLDPKDFETEIFDEKLILPFNKRYRIPESFEIVGDRSDRYIKLREQVDPLLPVDKERSIARVQELTKYSFQTATMDIHHSDVVPYDVYDCPETPPTNYPFSWNLVKLLENWPPDDPTPRPLIHQGLCVFDYEKDYKKALAYREAELPFVVANDPAVAQTVERWAIPGYIESMLGSEAHRCEYSENNHFMYYVPVPKNRRTKMQVPEGWHEPTKLIRMSFKDWLEHANVTDDKLGPDNPHWYYRLIGCGLMGNDGGCDKGSSEYLFDELPWFQPRKSLYIVEPEEQKGIHCRFGMKGVIAENHFDGSRNVIAVLGGSRRYILSHPNQCELLALYPKGHPSARHSAVDWSDPNLEEFPQFKEAMSNEVVLQAGQVLYLPTNWFHFIVSLELNFQCNTRSGVTDHYPMRSCGF